MQDDDIPGIVRFHTYEVLKEEVNNPRLRWAYLPYSMHMAGPREAIQHMIIRKNYGALPAPSSRHFQSRAPDHECAPATYYHPHTHTFKVCLLGHTVADGGTITCSWDDI